MMIGTKSFLLELVGLFFPLIPLALGIAAFRSGDKKLGLVFCGVALVFGMLMGNRYYHQVNNLYFLGRLSISEVASIRIHETTVTDPTLLRPIIRALNNRQWSLSSRGCADKVDLVVTLKNDDERRFEVAYYLRQPGALICFYRRSKYTYSSDGYAFSPDLPAALENAHLKLPEQP